MCFHNYLPTYLGKVCVPSSNAQGLCLNESCALEFGVWCFRGAIVNMQHRLSVLKITRNESPKGRAQAGGKKKGCQLRERCCQPNASSPSSAPNRSKPQQATAKLVPAWLERLARPGHWLGPDECGQGLVSPCVVLPHRRVRPWRCSRRKIVQHAAPQWGSPTTATRRGRLGP